MVRSSITSRKTYRVKSKFRFTLAVAVAIILLVTISNSILGLNQASSLTKESFITIEVQPGDSLWNIACEYGPEHTDIRKTVSNICDINGIDGKNLVPGQSIKVPDYSNVE